MRILPLVLTALALAGCSDALGVQSSCSSRMVQVRLQEGGSPDDTDYDENRGDFHEVWYFYDSGTRYDFRWGNSYDGCQLSQSDFSILPDPRKEG